MANLSFIEEWPRLYKPGSQSLIYAYIGRHISLFSPFHFSFFCCGGCCCYCCVCVLQYTHMNNGFYLDFKLSFRIEISIDTYMYRLTVKPNRHRICRRFDLYKMYIFKINWRKRANQLALYHYKWPINGNNWIDNWTANNKSIIFNQNWNSFTL